MASKPKFSKGVIRRATSWLPQLELVMLSLFALWISTASSAIAHPTPAPSGVTSTRDVGSRSPSVGPVVQIHNGPHPGSLEIRATQVTELAPNLMVERQRADGSYEMLRYLDLSSMKLVESCDQPIKTCVRVDKRGLRPKPWSGMSCSSQCNANCDRNVRLHGRFRFVVTTCDGRTRFEGAVFPL